MHEQLAGRLVAGAEQKRRPVDAVEAQDVLRQQMPNLGPEGRNEILAGSGVRQRADVVDERVGPHVGDRIGVPRDRDPPGLPRSADREVLEAALDEALRLVRPESREDEVGRARSSSRSCCSNDESRKNQFRSSIHSGSRSCSGHFPSTRSASVLKASQPTQYRPEYTS